MEFGVPARMETLESRLPCLGSEKYTSRAVISPLRPALFQYLGRPQQSFCCDSLSPKLQAALIQIDLTSKLHCTFCPDRPLTTFAIRVASPPFIQHPIFPNTAPFLPIANVFYRSHHALVTSQFTRATIHLLFRNASTC